MDQLYLLRIVFVEVLAEVEKEEGSEWWVGGVMAFETQNDPKPEGEVLGKVCKNIGLAEPSWRNYVLSGSSTERW